MSPFRVTSALVLAAALAALPFTLTLAPASAGADVKLDVPFVPTELEAVDAMLELAGVQPGDVVYDLGCGDGRIVIAAALRGATAVGVDIDPKRIREAKENAKAIGVEDRVRFIQGDLFEADIEDATVVTLYLLPEVNKKLKPRLLSELDPGTRVVSHDFDMGDWEPAGEAQVGDAHLYLWIVPDSHARRR